MSRKFVPKFRCWSPSYSGPSVEVLNQQQAEMLLKGRSAAQVGRVFASSTRKDGLVVCYVGTITALFKEHFRVTTRNGVHIKVPYLMAAVPESFTSYSDWDKKALESGADLLH
jgi:hypothetical protein